MQLYLVEADRSKDDYYVIAKDMNEAGEKVKNHLSATYKTTITIIKVTWIASACAEGTPDTFKSQYLLVL